jgi:arsenate reductase
MSNWELDADALHSCGARHALILSRSNSARGQIAEGIARALAPRQVRISSAGAARGAVDPLAVRVLAELSVNVAGQHSKALDEVDATDVQAILVLSEEDPTPAALRGVLRVHWPLPDPAAGGGTEEDKVARYRAVRNELRRRLIRVFAREALVAAAAAGATTSIGPSSGGDLDAIKSMLMAALLPSRDVGGLNQRFIVAARTAGSSGAPGWRPSARTARSARWPSTGPAATPAWGRGCTSGSSSRRCWPGSGPSTW